MGSAVTVEVTFVASSGLRHPVELPLAEGVVRLPDGTLQPFSGWIDLLAALEAVTVGLGPAANIREGAS
jgi:hypothetical protein